MSDEGGHTSPGAAGVYEGAEPPVLSGGERTRTAVQTSHQAAFYMLIRPLVFEEALPEGGRSVP